ncbi:ferrochelatase [Archangium lipolyticum]|uniref:ferrochelatase n=1 Tax=Archangium lipolyticum TaxID=2970465 RepID=UPI002149B3FA|nr:ferrochelatase [Archangium lipolyticum]
MRGLPEDILAGLERLAPLVSGGASLDPSRPRALLPVELAARVMDGLGDVERARAFAEGLGEVVRVFAEDFPDNIFWDLDYLACCMWNAGGPGEIEGFVRRVVVLCRGFGNKSELRFRYAHDFLYGYDWARWVARQPGDRAGIGPFDLAFFDYLDARRQTLLELIARNDAKYGQLQGPEFRNPFFFCREPREEAHLHQVLAQADLIPVKAWRLDGERRWDLPFTDLRTEAARRLGLARDATS